jgi:hypothetical protein
MQISDPLRRRSKRAGTLATLGVFSILLALAGCASGPTVVSESVDKVQISHGYPPPIKEVGELAADRCAAYGRAPVFVSDSPFDSETAVTNFRCVPMQ